MRLPGRTDRAHAACSQARSPLACSASAAFGGCLIIYDTQMSKYVCMKQYAPSRGRIAIGSYDISMLSTGTQSTNYNHTSFLNVKMWDTRSNQVQPSTNANLKWHRASTIRGSFLSNRARPSGVPRSTTPPICSPRNGFGVSHVQRPSP
jgi:hypothetical protein